MHCSGLLRERMDVMSFMKFKEQNLRRMVNKNTYNPYLHYGTYPCLHLANHFKA